MTSDPSLSVRGYTAYNRAARMPMRLAALAADAAMLLTIFFVSISLFRISPAFSLLHLVIAVAEAGIYFSFQLLVLQRTLGERLWRLKRTDRELLQHDQLSTPALMSASFLTTVSWIFAVLGFLICFHLHPLMRKAPLLELTAFSPPSQQYLGENWQIIPFFYSLGAWPSTFNGRPIFYSLPYEKGPPDRFVGHVIARWDAPEIKVTLEGPRSPIESWPRNKIRDCFARHGVLSLSCSRIRESTLLRHFEEMRGLVVGTLQGALPTAWKTEWFQVRNPALPESEWLQGLHLRVAGAARAQERFILISPLGVHQAIILDLSQSQASTHSRELFLAAISSLRMSDDLAPGRQWINDQLQRTRLDDLGSLSRSADSKGLVMLSEKISEIQAQLIAKISVDPKTFDTYFHLGGTAMILAKASRPEAQGESWPAIAQPLLQSLYKYAQDIAPSDPRTKQLLELSIEAQKL